MAVKKKKKKKAKKAKKRLKKQLPLVDKKSGFMVVPEKEFWALLIRYNGAYSVTARAIRKEYDCTMSRQAVQKRAEKEPDRIQEIRETIMDVAELTIMEAMRDTDIKVRLDAAKTVIKFKGKSRGWESRHGVEIEDKRPSGVIALPIPNPEPKQKKEDKIH